MNAKSRILVAAALLGASLGASACVVHEGYPGYGRGGYYERDGVRYRHDDSYWSRQHQDDDRRDRDGDHRGDHHDRDDRDEHHWDDDYRR